MSRPPSATNARSRSRTRSRTRSRPRTRPSMKPYSQSRQDLGVEPHRPIVPRSQAHPNVGTPRQRSPLIVPLAQIPRRRSPPPDPQVVSGQVQEEIMERQQQQTRVPAPQATPDWIPDVETTLTELTRDGLHIEDAAGAMNRAVEDVIQRWAQTQVENRESERRGRERHGAGEVLQSRRQPTNSPVTDQAPPAAHAAVVDRIVENVKQRLADIEIETREAERRGRERRRAGEIVQNRRQPTNLPVTDQSPPAAHAAVVDRIVENVKQRLADIEVETRETERRGRERQRTREQLENRHWPMNPLVPNQALPAAHAAVLDRTVENVPQRAANVEVETREAERRGRERQRTGEVLQNLHRPTNSPVPSPAFSPAYAAVLDRTVENVTQRLADIEDEDREAERRARERHRVRGELLADIEAQNKEAERKHRERQRAREHLLAGIENDNREAERRSRERQKAREEFQNHCRQTDPLETNRASPTSPAAMPDRVVENVAQRLANMEDEHKEAKWTVRERQRARDLFRNLNWPTNKQKTNQAPLAAPTAQQQKERSVRPTSRRPADRNTIADDAAPEPVPATLGPEREGPSAASYRYRDWPSERRGFDMDSTSIRRRPTHRYRSLSPQYRRERGPSTVEQRNQPATAPDPSQEPAGPPGNTPGPPRGNRPSLAWTLGANGWEYIHI